MKLVELRRALPVMTEGMIWDLADLYGQLTGKEDEGREYVRKMDAVEAELKRRENPRHHNKVDAKLARTPDYWNRPETTEVK